MRWIPTLRRAHVQLVQVDSMRPLVTCKIEGARAVHIAGVIDTGANRSAVSIDLLRLIGAERIGVCDVQTGYEVHRTELYRVRITPAGLREITVTVMATPPGYRELFVGLDLLVWFSFRQESACGYCVLRPGGRALLTPRPFRKVRPSQQLLQAAS